MNEQLELPLEYPTYDHYTIRLMRGAVGAMDVLRTHSATDAESAYNLIEGLRDTSASRDDVTWQREEVDEAGIMYGLAKGGVVYEISVVPPLHVALS